MQAKILSSGPRGAGTRIVRFEAGWGSRLAGTFTAVVEVFVIEGDLHVGSLQLSDYEYAQIPMSGVIGGFRSEGGAIALLMTSGPVRYDTSRGGARANVVLGRPTQTSWVRDGEDARMFARPLAGNDSSQVWLSSTQLDANAEWWHSHPHDEETFVLEGQLRYLDRREGETVTSIGRPGSYFYRPAGTEHTAPAARGEETVLMFNRSLGPHETNVVGDEPMSL